MSTQVPDATHSRSEGDVHHTQHPGGIFAKLKAIALLVSPDVMDRLREAAYLFKPDSVFSEIAQDLAWNANFKGAIAVAKLIDEDAGRDIEDVLDVLITMCVGRGEFSVALQAIMELKDESHGRDAEIEHFKKQCANLPLRKRVESLQKMGNTEPKIALIEGIVYHSLRGRDPHSEVPKILEQVDDRTKILLLNRIVRQLRRERASADSMHCVQQQQHCAINNIQREAAMERLTQAKGRAPTSRATYGEVIENLAHWEKPIIGEDHFQSPRPQIQNSDMEIVDEALRLYAEEIVNLDEMCSCQSSEWAIQEAQPLKEKKEASTPSLMAHELFLSEVLGLYITRCLSMHELNTQWLDRVLDVMPRCELRAELCVKLQESVEVLYRLGRYEEAISTAKKIPNKKEKDKALIWLAKCYLRNWELEMFTTLLSLVDDAVMVSETENLPELIKSQIIKKRQQPTPPPANTESSPIVDTVQVVDTAQALGLQAGIVALTAGCYIDRTAKYYKQRASQQALDILEHETTVHMLQKATDASSYLLATASSWADDLMKSWGGDRKQKSIELE